VAAEAMMRRPILGPAGVVRRCEAIELKKRKLNFEGVDGRNGSSECWVGHKIPCWTIYDIVNGDQQKSEKCLAVFFCIFLVEASSFAF
jgi:hypothetical protein